MKKRILSLLLSLIMVLSLLPTTAWAKGDHNQGGNQGGGGFQPSEEYYKFTDSFGYDSWTSGGSLTGLVSVKVGTTTLTRGTGSSTTGAAYSNGITVTLAAGYYISDYKYVCGDKYSCQTDGAGHVANGGVVRPGESASSITLTPTKANLGHSSGKTPYWLLLKLAQDTTQYRVTYDWGELAGKLTTNVPVDATGYLVNAVVTVKAPGTDATNEATGLGYVFTGWKADFNGETYQPDGKFGMPQKNVTLVAQWEPVPTGSLTITKALAGNGASAAASKTFTFTVKNAEGTLVTTKQITGAGSVTVDNLTPGTYTVTENTESAKVAGYTLSTTGTGNATVTAGSTANVTVTNTYTKEKTSVTVEKQWVDSENAYNTRPDSVTVKLLADGVDTGKTLPLNADNSWKDTFTDLDKYTYKPDGSVDKEITYTVEEVNVNGKYTASVSGNIVTNTLKTGSLTIEKKFTNMSNQPLASSEYENAEITVTVKGVDTFSAYEKTVTLNKDNNWTETLTGLPLGGNYTMAEDTSTITVANYTWNSVKYSYREGNSETECKKTGDNQISFSFTAVKDGRTYIVTNQYKPDEISITVTKDWKGDEGHTDLRPSSISVQLYADGEAVTGGAAILTAADNWKYTFTGLQKYKANGNEIVYTVDETTVPTGYKKDVNGFTITNTADWDTPIVNKASVTVTKYNDDKSETLPGAEFTLYKWNKTTQKYDIKIATGYTSSETANKGEYTFTDLVDGKYRLVETKAPDGYKLVDQPVDFEVNVTSMTDNKTGKFQTTTTYTADKSDIEFTNKALTSITVTKSWVDQNDTYKLRPKTVTVQLYKNGEAYGTSVTLNADADGNWKYTFNDLFVYDEQNTAIAYTVAELDVDSNYTASVDGFTITNTLKTGGLTINKENKGATPDSATFTVTGPNNYSKEVTLNADNNWTTTLNDLPVGTYNVTENAGSAKADCYTLAKVEGEGDVSVTENGGSITITNTYEHETINIPVSKVWKGDEKNPELRPASITVNLMNGTEVIATKELTAENDWNATFEAVRKYDDNNTLITYTVEEVAVENYKTGVVTPNNDGSFTITNELAPTEYKATVDIEKTVKKTGGNMTPGQEEFIFLAYYKDTEKNVNVGEVRIITNGVDANGEKTYPAAEMELTVLASAFDLDANGNGTVTLSVSEVKGSAAGWTYDETVYTLIMTVKNYEVAGITSGDTVEIIPNGDSVPDSQLPEIAPTVETLTFTNEFSQTKTPNRPNKPSKPITSVKTGDAGVAMYAMSGLLSLGGAALFMKKRKDEE